MLDTSLFSGKRDTYGICCIVNVILAQSCKMAVLPCQGRESRSMTTCLQLNFQNCWAAPALAGCGMSHPGRDASRDAVPHRGSLGSRQDGQKRGQAALTALREAARAAGCRKRDNDAGPGSSDRMPQLRRRV